MCGLLAVENSILASDESKSLRVRVEKELRAEKSKLKQLENDQQRNHPHLLETIVSLVSVGGAAHGRRREEILRSCRTLNDLHNELLSLGHKISRSATYLRLLPWRLDSSEGRRHVRTVPVKLIKAQTSEHKSHLDKYFCKTTISALNSLASFLGPDQVFFLSQDDKCRVPLGITISKKQKSLLMRVDYRITLPDHD